MAGCPNCGADLLPPYQFCSRCGQAIASPPVYPPAYPPPYAYLPPRKDNTALIIVMVIVLVLAVPTILAAMLYVLTSGLVSTPPVSRMKPTVTLTYTKTYTGVDILVAGAYPVISPSNFKVNLVVGNISGTPVSLGAAGAPTYVTVASSNYAITWQNPGGSGEVAQGDSFVVAYPVGAGAPSSGTTIIFVLLWSDGSSVTQISWQV